jgi:hypothetical protein
MKIKNLVRDLLLRTLPAMLNRGWDTTRVVEECRLDIWETLVINGAAIEDVSLKKICKQLIKQSELLPQTEGWDIQHDPALVHDTPPTGESRVSRYPSRKRSAAADAMGTMLEKQEWQQDEEITGIQLDIYASIDSLDDREKVIPARCLAEIQRVGSNGYRVSHGISDTADRVYIETKGTFGYQWGSFDRTRNVNPEFRTTDLCAQGEHLESEFGIDSEALIGDILADPKAAYHRGVSMKAITQCISWHRIATTGKTNIPVEGDAVASGYVLQLALKRDREFYMRAFPNNRNFIHPHNTLSEGIRECTPAFRGMSVGELKPLSKFIFTPSIYGAGGGGLFHSATGERKIEDLYGEEGWDVVPLPPLVDVLLEGVTSEEERAVLLYSLCKNWSAIFRTRLRKVPAFNTYWMNRWLEQAKPEGLYIPRYDGSEVLVPRMRRNRDETTEYTHTWWEGKDRLEKCVSLFSPRLDDEGTATSAFVCQNRDAAAMGNAVPLANGAIMGAIHDAAIFMLADESIVQRAYNKGVKIATELDIMGTGLAPLAFSDDEKFLKL